LNTSLRLILVRARVYLHENAEVHDDLPVTTAFVKSCLEEVGYNPEEICKSGVVALAGKDPGNTILVRADMDALPISEETDLEFRSRTGYMHACGHDLHTAMLLGAAQLLKDHEGEIEGHVTLMFQPSEAR
jgi:amidohydrolase